MSDWLVEIKKHHKGIKKAFDVAIELPSFENVSNLCDLIDSHSIAEEACIYPQLSKHGMDDEQLEAEQTQAKLVIHQTVHLCSVQPLTKSQTLYVVARLKDLKAAVLEHAIEHEEKDKFKKLHADLSEVQSERLGNMYMKKYGEWNE